MSGGFRGVDVFTAAAVELDRFLVWDVCKSDREKRLRLAEHARTSAEVSPFVFFELTKDSRQERR